MSQEEAEEQTWTMDMAKFCWTAARMDDHSLIKKRLF